MKLKKPNLTYRTKKRLKTAGLTFGIVTAVCVIAWLCWFVWLGRFVVYSQDEVRLDFGWVTPGEFVEALPPEDAPVNIIYDDGSEVVVEKKKELEQISGYYVTTDMLVDDIEEVDSRIRELPKGTTIMLELKSGLGNFYYDTELPDGKVSSKVDEEAVGDLIKYLARADYYTVACVPAFRDRAFGLDNTAYGIHHSSGRYLWAGDDKCYWLDPVKNGTRSHLISIASELRDMGFDEVLFTDFCFPPTEDILYEGDKLTALNETAAHLVYNLATEDFCVSFLCNETGFTLPEGRTRLYRSDVDAALAQSVAATLGVPNTQINLVYLTEAMDTRFDAYGVLRPLPIGMAELPTATTAPEDQPEAQPEVQPEEGAEEQPETP